MAYMRGEMLEYEQLGRAYDYLATRLAKGAPLQDLEVEAQLTEILTEEWYDVVSDPFRSRGNVATYTKQVLWSYRARRQASYLQNVAEETARLLGSAEHRAREIADAAIGKLATMHTVEGDLQRPATRQEITDRALDRVAKRTKSAGLPWPYSKLQDQIGNLLAGDVIGITGYSGAGKSLLVANLWRLFVMAGVPVISFPTEMGLAWHARGVAAQSRVPQLIAEREQWDMANEQQIGAYEAALRELGGKQWEIVDRGSITVAEIIARTTVLRRQWPNQTVVLIVDHMHRLNYGKEEADVVIGTATKEIRNWIREDEYGGMIALLLYQPRKPSDEVEFYKPVSGYQIRGKIEVFNELDILLSPYRRWVKTDARSKTPWGSPATQYDEGGYPSFAAPNAKGAKLDDERLYVKIGKRRVGGEGPTIMLHVDEPSGYVFQLDRPKLVRVGDGVA